MTPPNIDPFDRRLAPDLFNRRFDDLFELGRSQLPRLAPEWTDHNRHDPGITLIELLAWVAEAQLYSLARLRRDERAAYAALLGVPPRGPQPASGLLWPLVPRPGGLAQSLAIETDALVRTEGSAEPGFRPQHRMLWVAGRIRALHARFARGESRDLTRANERGGAPFLPFGEVAGPRDVLALEFECASDAGLFPPRRAAAEGARMIVGVRAEPTESGKADLGRERHAASLEVTLVAGGERFELPVLEDATQGFLRTGAIVLDPGPVRGSTREFTLEFRAPRGFERPPRIRAIALNVLPIVQGERVERESHTATGLPDQDVALGKEGLCYGVDAEPLEAEVGGAPFTVWQRRASLAECGPDERVYELDAVAGRVRFGNGVNGAIPAAGAQILLSYRVCDGEAGNVARNHRWLVRGISGVFGSNPDAIAGGTDAAGALEQRREARRHAREHHALVTSADITSAALDMAGLEVARAWILAPRDNPQEKGRVTLVAMRARPGGVEPDEPPETPRWLAALRRRLAPRLPLGTPFAVVAPVYVRFHVGAKLEADSTLDRTKVKEAALAALKNRLALIKSDDGSAPREPGVEVTSRDIAAWLLKTPGVRSVSDVRIILADGRKAEGDWLPRRGLPKLDVANSELAVATATARKTS